MSAEPQHEEEEQFHSGEEGEVDDALDEIVLGARRSKASDDEESVDDGELTVPPAEPLDGNGTDAASPAAGGDAAPDQQQLDVNLPDDLNEGDLGAVDRTQKPKERPKFEPYVVPTAGAFYMHDDRFDETAEVVKPRRAPRKVDENDRWKHDKFEAIENGQSDDDEPPAHFGFRQRGRGRGRGRGGRRGGYGGGFGGRGGQGPPPGFEESSSHRPKRAGPHPAEALREAESYEPESFGPPPSLNPDAQPFRSGAQPAQDEGNLLGGQRKGTDWSEDPPPSGGRQGEASGGGRARTGGRRYSAMAGNLGGGN